METRLKNWLSAGKKGEAKDNNPLFLNNKLLLLLLVFVFLI